MARHRHVLLATLCALVACASPPAFAGQRARARSHRAHVRSNRGAPVRHARGHRFSCVSALGRRSRGSHVRRASFRSGTPVRGRGHHCLRHRVAGRRQSLRLRNGVLPFRSGVPASNSSTCPDADLTPTPEDLARVRAATLCLVNRERSAHGESPLSESARLEQAAQAHSEDMAARDYFDHVGPRGDTPLSRIRATGYIFNSQVGYEIGENIGWGTLWLSTPRAIVAAWMASPGHRENILGGGYRDTAIGVSPHPPASMAGGQPGAIYTQDFALLIKA